jgi:hypothetical protein
MHVSSRSRANTGAAHPSVCTAPRSGAPRRARDRCRSGLGAACEASAEHGQSAVEILMRPSIGGRRPGSVRAESHRVERHARLGPGFARNFSQPDEDYAARRRCRDGVRPGGVCRAKGRRNAAANGVEHDDCEPGEPDAARFVVRAPQRTRRGPSAGARCAKISELPIPGAGRRCQRPRLASHARGKARARPVPCGAS